jgi:hypothetical protein
VVRRPSTGFLVASLLGLAETVTLGALALRGGTPEYTPDQAFPDAPTPSSDVVGAPPDVPEPSLSATSDPLAPQDVSLDRLDAPPERSLRALSADTYAQGLLIHVEFLLGDSVVDTGGVMRALRSRVGRTIEWCSC